MGRGGEERTENTRGLPALASILHWNASSRRGEKKKSTRDSARCSHS